MANVDVVEHGNGDVSLGVTIEGAFVPFATVTAARIAGLQERAASLRERGESDDPEDKRRVEDALAALPIEPAKASRSKAKANKDEDEASDGEAND